MKMGSGGEGEGVAVAVAAAADKYRSVVLLQDEVEKNTHWRHGGPPTYDSVNLLFEQGRTKVSLSLSLSLPHVNLCPLCLL